MEDTWLAARKANIHATIYCYLEAFRAASMQIRSRAEDGRNEGFRLQIHEGLDTTKQEVEDRHEYICNELR